MKTENAKHTEDAKLLRAAPELLEAARVAEDVISRIPSDKLDQAEIDTLAILRSAIAKATNEKS